ncbi:hypothetical protein R1sor_016464 [Riccia sorocarpa]|uniref:non-specific serine/threonine protein kinase n=1 Tax=Riccia sorocarpa TaxID=122646 RepID=A0ABD3HJ62_9MARC
MKAPAADFVLCRALLCIVISSPFVRGQVAGSYFNSEDSKFSCAGSGANLRCSGNATTTTDGLLKLTPDPSDRKENSSYSMNTVGVALYKNPVQVMNRVWMGEPGWSFGAFNGYGFAGVQTLAVEFDTVQNQPVDDVDDNHVGIDTTSTKPEKATSLTFPLSTGNSNYAWIQCHPESLLLEVRVDSLPERSDQPTISYNLNLVGVFDVDNVSVGFTAANGNCATFCFSSYTVYNLTFQSSFSSSSPPFPAPKGKSQTGANSTRSTRSESNTQKSKPLNSGFIAGVTVGLVGILVGACSLLFCTRSLRKHEAGTVLLSVKEGSSTKEFQMAGVSVERFSYDQVSAATENFSDALKLGQGGFGSVYRGSIPVEGSNSNLLVAVKKVSSDSKQGEREFMAEVSTVGMLRHRNIVQLLGWCSESQGNYLLVCEYMQKGSLDQYLYPRRISQTAGNSFFLTWKERIKILRGIAASLQFLHEGWRQQIIHRDVKSSNVMLDDDLNAMLGDFGLARMSDNFRNPTTTGVAGTYGFIAPEVAMTGKYTVKSDVFSFGAVCLEVVCGRRVYDDMYPVDEILSVDSVWRKLSEDDLLSVVDRRLEGEFEVEEVKFVPNLLNARRCRGFRRFWREVWSCQQFRRPSLKVIIMPILTRIRRGVCFCLTVSQESVWRRMHFCECLLPSEVTFRFPFIRFGPCSLPSSSDSVFRSLKKPMFLGCEYFHCG